MVMGRMCYQYGGLWNAPSPKKKGVMNYKPEGERKVERPGRYKLRYKIDGKEC